LGILVLASLLLKQILIYDVGYDVPTSWRTVQCALFMWLCLHNLYLIKETTPYFLFTKYRIFVQNQLGDLFLKYRQYLAVPKDIPTF